MEINTIIKDLRESLQIIDKQDYVLNSIINHLEEQCSPEEIQIIEDKILQIDIKEYSEIKDFIEDYGAIFYLVDFPLVECFRVMEKRKLNYNNL